MPSPSRPHPAPVGAICPAGRFAIALDGASWLVRDALTRRPARVGALVGLPPRPLALALAPGGRALVVGGADGSVTEFELTTGRVRWTVRAHRSPVVAVATDGRRVTSVAADGTVWSDGPPAAPAGNAVRAVRVGLAVAVAVAAGAGWLPLAALAAVPVLLGVRARRRLRLRLSVSGSEREGTRG